MNFKTTYILFGTLFVLLAVACISLLTGTKQGDEGVLLAKFKADNVQAKDITRLVIDRRQPTDLKLVFVRVDKDRWKLEEPYTARVDAFQIDRLIGDLLAARKVVKGVDLTNNPTQFGLDQPAVVVTLSAGDKQTSVNLGKLSFGEPDTSVVYVTSSDSPKDVAAVRRSSLGGLFKEAPNAQSASDLVRGISDFRPRDLILERAANPIGVVKSVRIKGEKGEVVINKTSDGKWQYAAPTGFGDADVDGDTGIGAGGDTTPTGVKPLLDSIARIQAGSGDDYVENVTDFGQYGLAAGKEAGPKIEIVRENPAEKDAPPITETLHVGKKDEKGDKIFVRPGDEAAVVKVTANLIEPVTKLLEKPGSLRDRNLLSIAATAADGVDVQVGKDPPFEFRRTGEPPAWRLYNADGSSVLANPQTVNALLNAIGTKRSVKDFPEKGMTDAALGFDHPSAVVTLWVGGILPEEKKEEKKDEKKDDKPKTDDKKDDKAKPDDKKDEKKDAKPEEKKPPAKPKMKDPTVRLIFGRKDKDLLFVRRIVGGVQTDLALGEGLLGTLTRGRLDYLDMVLPSFVVEQAQKITLVRGGETVVLEKQKKDDKSPEVWTIVQPTNLAGRPADRLKVNLILGELVMLKAERLWAEKATDKELERFGLKPPKMSATITLKDGPDTERVYLFGNESEDKSTVFAKQGERDLVFGVRKGSIEGIERADFVDPMVFSLDLTKVTGMKLTGWKEYSVNAQPQTLDLERKGANNWSVKGGTGYKLSAAAAEEFLTALASVRAEKVVVFKTGGKPEHKLTPAEGALVVELTIDGEKEPTSLAIGGLDADGKNYFATSNKLPGDVFLLAKGSFEKYKTKPNAFAAE